MLSNSEVAEVRRLAAKIRTLKDRSYDSITWEKAIDQVVRANTTSEGDFFRKTALLDFFLYEDRNLSPLTLFLEGLEENILNRRQRAADYAITETERVDIRRKVDCAISALAEPLTERTAFDRYQLLIDRVFTSETFDDLHSSLRELAALLRRFFPSAYPDVQVLAEHSPTLVSFISELESGATKQQIATELGMDPDTVGLCMYRLAQLGVCRVAKRGRQNEYLFGTATLDINALRREWDWLWSQPFKRLTLRSYERTSAPQSEA